jgi:hypothetical protein
MEREVRPFSKPWQLVEHDEPFEVQDPATSDQVREAIRRLVELGRADPRRPLATRLAAARANGDILQFAEGIDGGPYIPHRTETRETCF